MERLVFLTFLHRVLEYVAKLSSKTAVNLPVNINHITETKNKKPPK